MVNFVLFGHSFVKRLGNKKSFVMTVELERSQVPITCLGEGGLTLDRIRSKPGVYLRQLDLGPTLSVDSEGPTLSVDS